MAAAGCLFSPSLCFSQKLSENPYPDSALQMLPALLPRRTFVFPCSREQPQGLTRLCGAAGRGIPSVRMLRISFYSPSRPWHGAPAARFCGCSPRAVSCTGNRCRLFCHALCFFFPYLPFLPPESGKAELACLLLRHLQVWRPLCHAQLRQVCPYQCSRYGRAYRIAAAPYLLAPRVRPAA